MKCPICKSEGKPLCPYFKKCKYRKMDLCPIGVCWNNPKICDIFDREKKMEKPNFNPSQRNLQ